MAIRAVKYDVTLGEAFLIWKYTWLCSVTQWLENLLELLIVFVFFTYQYINIENPAVLSRINTKRFQVYTPFAAKYPVECICYLCAKFFSSPAFKFRSSICRTR